MRITDLAGSEKEGGILCKEVRDICNVMQLCSRLDRLLIISSSRRSKKKEAKSKSYSNVPPLSILPQLYDL